MVPPRRWGTRCGTFLPSCRAWEGVADICLASSWGPALFATLPSGGSAEGSGELERRADALRTKNAALAAGAQSALADLAAIESRLEAHACGLRPSERAVQVRARRRAVREPLESPALPSARFTEPLPGDSRPSTSKARRTRLRLSQVALARRGSERDRDTRPRRDAGRESARPARTASVHFASLSRTLAGRERELEQLAAVRAAAAASLAEARSDRLRTIAAVQAARRSNSAQISGLEERARTLASVLSTPALAPGRVATAASVRVCRKRRALVDGGRNRVFAPGTTAAGCRWAGAQWPSILGDPDGIAPEDPGLRPRRGRRRRQRNQGARIDLWFPTVAQARAWGSRVVTITVHSN